MAPLYAWAQGVQNARIALTGPFSNDSYPLYGRDDSNYVQVIGKVGSGGSFSPITSCVDFRQFVNAGHYTDVAVITATLGRGQPQIGTRESLWTSRNTGAKLIFRGAVLGYVYERTVFSVFRVEGTLDPKTCP